MAKKTAAQLQREIEEVLHSPGGKQPLRPPRTSSKATLARAARKANDEIYDFIHNKYFQSLPVNEIFDIVKRAGFRFDPKDEEFFLLGRSGRETWELFDPESGRQAAHLLVLSWHKMDVTGRYEVVAYVS